MPEQRGSSINLNTASVEIIAALPGLGSDQTKLLVERRPFRSWDEIKRLPGFSQRVIEQMQRNGAALSLASSAHPAPPPDEWTDESAPCD